MTQISKVRGVATTTYTNADGALCVRYHNTTVYSKYKDRSVLLDIGGRKTATTKLRMNQAFNQFGPFLSDGPNGYNSARYAVFQENRKWYVSDRSQSPWRIVPFENDMLVLRNEEAVS